MKWLKELLKTAGVEKVDDLKDKISKELPIGASSLETIGTSTCGSKTISMF